MAVRTLSRARPRAETGRGFVRVLVVWASWLVLMAGANLATPLYAVYASRFGFSSLVLTSIFATYAFVLVPSLVLFGRLSDRFGRRPVVLLSNFGLALDYVLMALAPSLTWLFVGRVISGITSASISTSFA